MANKDTEFLGMPIQGELLMMFRRVKEHKGIHNSTELVRVLIKEAFDRIGPAALLSPSTLRLIELYLQSNPKYRTHDELIEAAVRDWIQKKGKP